VLLVNQSADANYRTSTLSARRQPAGGMGLILRQSLVLFAVYAAAKAYVLRLGKALHRELRREGITVAVLCQGTSDTGFPAAAEPRLTPALKLVMMQAPPVVRAGIRALQAGRISVVAVGQQGHRDVCLGNASLAAPGRPVPRHERMTEVTEAEDDNRRCCVGGCACSEPLQTVSATIARSPRMARGWRRSSPNLRACGDRALTTRRDA
jgi:hypothetical protein